METKKGKIIQISIATILLIIAFIIEKTTSLSNLSLLFIYLIPYFVVGFDVIKEAFEGLKEKELFNEHFLMTLATIGALIIGFLPNAKNQFLEAVFVMLFFQVGELFEIIAEGKSEKSISSLLEIRPDYAKLLTESGIKKVDPNTIKIDDVIIVNPGEKIALDGEIIEGETNLNTMAITGESMLKSVKIGDEVYSGSINIDGSIKIKVKKLFSQSTASKIIELVETATETKSKHDKFISSFSKIYTPVVVISALLFALIPSLVTKNYATWIARALTFLIVSCPCALVISIPLSYFGGIGACARVGILIKGATYLEALTDIKTIVFDKTGTITEGSFKVVAIHPEKFNEKELLHLATHVENYSSHPIAQSLKSCYSELGDINDNCEINDIKELAGLGMSAKVNGDIVYVGNLRLMEKIGITVRPCEHIGTIVHVASKNEYLGHIVILDQIKADAKSAISEFKAQGFKTVMLSGDNAEVVKSVAKEVKIDEYQFELMPEQKLDYLKEIIKNKGKNEVVAYVGDGINDAPSLKQADLGISMGAIGSDSAIEASDIVLMEDKISKLSEAIKISKKTKRISKQNIIFSLLIKFGVLALACFGLAPISLAIFADVGVTVLAILNAMRTLK